MLKTDIFATLLPAETPTPTEEVEAFASANIALCKYWGKRNKELNLPVNDSLSISLGHLGSKTRLIPLSDDSEVDVVSLNGEVLANDDAFVVKLIQFLDYFRRDERTRVQVETHNNIPTAAGLASSASGFAALTLAIDKFYGFNLPTDQLSALARMGSGSACRSLYSGFVQWEMGVREDGMDSHGYPLEARWGNLRLGLLTLTEKAKAVGSREGMQRTIETAHLYQSWPAQAAADLLTLQSAITEQNFQRLGETAEHNALAMHATMIASWPPLLYWQPESVATMHKIWTLRENGLPVYFTMDAGPNIKLLFQAEDQAEIEAQFPHVTVVAPFA